MKYVQPGELGKTEGDMARKRQLVFIAVYLLVALIGSASLLRSDDQSAGIDLLSRELQIPNHGLYGGSYDHDDLDCTSAVAGPTAAEDRAAVNCTPAGARRHL